MAKYTDVLRDVEGVFASSSLKAFPSNYQGSNSLTEFVKIEVIPGKPLTTYGSPGVQGQIIIQIYVTAGNGMKRIHEIADILDELLQRKELERGTITETSSMSIEGIDQDDKTLFRADYNVSFKKY